MAGTANETDVNELLRQFAREGSDDSFAKVVNRHIDLVYSAAMRQVGDHQANAADVTQAVFVELAQNAERLSNHPAITGWLYTTTRRMAMHAVRGEIRRRQREQEANGMQGLLSDAVEPEWERIRPALDAAMHDLREPDRLAVLWRYFEQRPLAEIGARLGVGENAARMRVDRALDRLRARLAKRGVTSTAVALGIALASQSVLAAPAPLASVVAASASPAGAAAGFHFGSLSHHYYISMTSKCIKITAAAFIVAALGTAMFRHLHHGFNARHTGSDVSSEQTGYGAGAAAESAEARELALQQKKEAERRQMSSQTAK
jgi:RNA polymerase sigma factor (sigma-70 family)